MKLNTKFNIKVNYVQKNPIKLFKVKIPFIFLVLIVTILFSGAAKATNTLGVHEKKVIAYHESGHALVGWLLEHTDALLKVTIVPRTSGVGGFAQYLPKENKMYSKEQLFDIMCMALGGRVAETVIFNHLSTGKLSLLVILYNLCTTLRFP